MIKKSKSTKPAKKPVSKIKKQKVESLQLSEIIKKWDEDQGPLPSLYDLANKFDEVCNRLVEIKHLLDAALEDTFGIENERTITMFLLAERMIKELVDKTDGLTSELYRVNRAQHPQQLK